MNLNTATSEKRVTANKLTRDIKGNHKNYSKQISQGKNEKWKERTWDRLKTNSKMIELNPSKVNPTYANAD